VFALMVNKCFGQSTQPCAAQACIVRGAQLSGRGLRDFVSRLDHCRIFPAAPHQIAPPAAELSRATVLATSSNFVGLGIGALISGLLAEYAPSPLQLPFIAYLLAVIPALALVWLARETVSRTVRISRQS
jgi:hypothetical protein